MKYLYFPWFGKNLIKITLAFIIGLPFASCESLYDEQGDCDPHYYLQFVFDRNMHYNDTHGLGADAFAAQVNSVDVYFFDVETGEQVLRLEDYGSQLREYGYSLPVDIKPGKYEIIAWCGLNDNENHFMLPSTIYNKEDLKCRMIRKAREGENTSYSDECLHPLFHGSIIWDMPDKEGNHYNTIYLTKDTNYIQLSLQHRSGVLDPDRFEIKMEDANGYLSHENLLLEDEIIQYRPWSQSGGIVDMETSTRAENDNLDNGTGFLVAELATSRLMADRNPILSITDKETGDIVFSIPLVKYVLTMKSQRYALLDDQEYLDREDEYAVMVFLENKDNEGWLAAQIVINGWHITDNGNVGL